MPALSAAQTEASVAVAAAGARYRPRRHATWTWLAAGDLLALGLAFLLAYVPSSAISFELLHRPFLDFALTDEIGGRVVKYGLLCLGIGVWLHGRGHYTTRLPWWSELRDLLIGCAIFLVLDGFTEYAAKTGFSRLWLSLAWMLAAFLLILGRIAVKTALRHAGVWDLPVMVVGGGRNGHDVVAALESEPLLGYRVVGRLDPRAESVEEMLSRREMHDVALVVAALDDSEMAEGRKLVEALTRRGFPLVLAPPLLGVATFSLRAQYFFSHEIVLLVERNALSGPIPRAIKRLFDLVVASALLVVLWPLLLGIALAVRADGGPAIFAHRRVGLGGKSFGCLKFRTMVIDADATLQRLLDADPEAAEEWRTHRKLRHDPRVTRLGAFLRRTALDELPQLVNVLKGEMSLVGPRPIVAAEVPLYGEAIATYYAARPGMTGLWQASGRNEVDYDRRVALDQWYVRNWSLWHDVAILCKTVPVLLSRRGAS